MEKLVSYISFYVLEEHASSIFKVEECSRLLQNIVTHISNYMASHPRRLYNLDTHHCGNLKCHESYKLLMKYITVEPQ
jgi:hypothetical protein